MIPLPYILGALVAVFVLGCFNGYAIRNSSAKSAATKAYKAAEGQRIILQGQLDVVSTKYEKERERANRVSVERYNTVREYYRTAPSVDPSCGLPDLPYSLLVNSVRDANVAASGEPSNAMPKSADTASH